MRRANVYRNSKSAAWRRSGRTRSGTKPRPFRSTLTSLPPGLSAAAIVSVLSEEDTIRDVLHQLKRLPLQELIVVMNGSNDRTFDKLASFPGITIVHYPEPLGYDVGRAVGAKLAQSEILLFTDGDIPVAAEDLAPFLLAVHRGADIALNDIGPFLGGFWKWDAVSRVKAFLNLCLRRPDLQANSLTTIPHAISRRTLDIIGPQLLMVPPVAHAAAIRNGLRIESCKGVNVFAANRVRRNNRGSYNQVARLIMGDHLEALARETEGAGPRLSWEDCVRSRSFAEGGTG